MNICQTVMSISQTKHSERIKQKETNKSTNKTKTKQKNPKKKKKKKNQRQEMNSSSLQEWKRNNQESAATATHSANTWRDIAEATGAPRKCGGKDATGATWTGAICCGKAPGGRPVWYASTHHKRKTKNKVQNKKQLEMHTTCVLRKQNKLNTNKSNIKHITENLKLIYHKQHQ